jgi:methyl-accepting chemotaxis protein
MQIQEATQQAVVTVRNIAATINQIHGIGTNIAAAVEEQVSARQKIARCV